MKSISRIIVGMMALAGTSSLILLSSTTFAEAGKIGDVPPSPLSAPENYNGGPGYYRGPDIETLAGGPIRHQPNYWVFGEGLYWDLENAEFNENFNVTDTGSGEQLVGAGTDIGEEFVPGFRVGVGAWFDQGQNIGLEMSGFYIPESDDAMIVRSTAGGNVLLGTRINGVPASLAFNSIAVENEVEMAGFDALAVGKIHREKHFEANWLAGFKYLNLTDESIVQYTTVGNQAFRDEYKADTHFFGAVAGVKARAQIEGFFADFFGKLALGASYMEYELDGNSTANPASGLLNNSQEFGIYEKVDFAVVAEARASSWDITLTILLNSMVVIACCTGVRCNVR